jgi:hypothetical protein
MRFTISLPRPKFWQALIVTLLLANLALAGARIALATDFEGGNPPPFAHSGWHLGCIDKAGTTRIFLGQHSTYGTTPQDSCQPNEDHFAVFIQHD